MRLVVFSPRWPPHPCHPLLQKSRNIVFCPVSPSSAATYFMFDVFYPAPAGAQWPGWEAWIFPMAFVPSNDHLTRPSSLAAWQPGSLSSVFTRNKQTPGQLNLSILSQWCHAMNNETCIHVTELELARISDNKQRKRHFKIDISADITFINLNVSNAVPWIELQTLVLCLTWWWLRKTKSLQQCSSLLHQSGSL